MHLKLDICNGFCEVSSPISTVHYGEASPKVIDITIKYIAVTSRLWYRLRTESVLRCFHPHRMTSGTAARLRNPQNITTRGWPQLTILILLLSSLEFIGIFEMKSISLTMASQVCCKAMLGKLVDNNNVKTYVLFWKHSMKYVFFSLSQDVATLKDNATTNLLPLEI